jgi:hypothetical protein
VAHNRRDLAPGRTGTAVPSQLPSPFLGIGLAPFGIIRRCATFADPTLINIL